MIEGYAVSGIAFAAMLLYGYRSGTVLRAARWAERVARLSLVALLGTIAVAYLDVATNQDALLWRQWLVCAALVGVAFGHAALLWRLSRGHDQYR